MTKVATILARKGKHAISISPDTSVLEALQLMAEKNIGSLVVLQDGKYQGIMTERDYSRKVILKGKHSNDTTVGEIMSTDLPSITPNDPIEHCMALMSDKNVRYLPVFDGENLAGIISISDVVTETIMQQRETINQLQSYIQG
ncbi:MAG: CBS domain-containing protein [Niabella sp.]|nr:MAG: CBS domain-containing protein [Niabella sp.]